MERKDGYINLDSVKDKIEIKDEFKTDIKGYYYRFTIANKQGEYYFKECSYEEAITELIVNEMLDILGIENVKYDMAILNGHRGVISESFRRPGFRYYTGKQLIDTYLENLPVEIEENEGTELGDILKSEYDEYKNEFDGTFTKNNFELIIHAIDYHTRNRDDKLDSRFKILDKLVTFHLADIMLLNQDRNRTNWLVEENDDEIGLVRIFDNGEAFKDKGWIALRVIPIERESVRTNTYIELKDFITRSDSSYFERFKDIYSKLSPEVLEACIEKVEEKTRAKVIPNVRSKIINTYKNHYGKIGKMIDSKCKMLPDSDDDEYDNR